MQYFQLAIEDCNLRGRPSSDYIKYLLEIMSFSTITTLELPENARVFLSNHPVLRHKLTKLRDERTDCNIFRHVLREVTFYLGYEATQDFSIRKKFIMTPYAPYDGSELSTKVALIPILRAGLGMVDAMLDLLPNATVHHIGMYRSKESLLPIQYYNKLPKICDSDVAIVLEPMIATAGTINAVVSILKTWGVLRIKIVSTVASLKGINELHNQHPDVDVIIGAIDDTLSDNDQIIPGLGDAGDRQFSTQPTVSAKRPRGT